MCSDAFPPPSSSSSSLFPLAASSRLTLTFFFTINFLNFYFSSRLLSTFLFILIVKFHLPLSLSPSRACGCIPYACACMYFPSGCTCTRMCTQYVIVYMLRACACACVIHKKKCLSLSVSVSVSVSVLTGDGDGCDGSFFYIFYRRWRW